MPSVIIPGEVEPLSFFARDSAGVLITGKTDLLIRIIRTSDEYVYDWSDDTFKSAGWTSPTQAMTENAQYNGLYHLDFDTSVIVNPTATGYDKYLVELTQSPGTDVANVPVVGEINSAPFADDASVARMMGVNDLALASGSVGNWVLKDDAGAVKLTFNVTDKDGNAISLNTGVPARRSKGV